MKALLLTLALLAGPLWAKGDLAAVQAAIAADQAKPLPVNPYISLNPQVEEQLAKAPAGPLHHWLLAIKDNIEVKGLATTAGSLALKDYVPRQDAPLVQRLKAAGALVLGKSNLSEWANFRGQRSISGWSATGGQTRLPQDPRRSPCGSSSGSAAAVAAGMADGAIGTETDGSITCPAAMAGLVGLKPTLGAVSQTGIVPLSQAQDVAGPITRTVDDAAALLLAMADPAYFAKDTLPAIKLADLRVGVWVAKGGFDDRVATLLDRAAKDFKATGARVDIVAPIVPDSLADDAYQALLWEFKQDLGRYLAALPPSVPVRSLEQLVQFNRAHADRELRYFGQETLEAALSAKDASAARQQAQSQARAALDQLFDQGFDLVIAPTNGPAWLIDRVNGDFYRGGTSTLAAVAGYPHLTVPMGDIDGLPIGLSLLGPAGSDLKLLATAKAWRPGT